MKKIFQLAIGVVFLSNLAVAQNEVDALRYSQLNFSGGTARSSAMGGAFGALGGDFSTLSINPAGIGVYRRNEFTCTPSFFNQRTTSNYTGNMLDDYKSNLNFSNVGIVLAYYDENAKNDWKGIVFGFGYNRLNNFNNQIVMEGKNNNSSLLDIYLADAKAQGGDVQNFDQFGTKLAWDTYLLDTLPGGSLYHVLPQHGEIQSKSVTTSGSTGETVFSLGGNYSDKLYMGATLGMPHIRYNEESTYQEKVDSNGVNGFKSYSLNQNLTTTGVGFNMKFGMIYKPVDWVRIGGAVHSPSYYNMHDSWSSSMTSHFTTQTYDETSPTGTFDYSLTTPMRAIGSLGFVIKKIGLIDADYEFVDYSAARLHSSQYDFLNENTAIRNKYTQANNFRIGTEWRFNPMSIRAGVAYYGTPYKKEVGNDGSRISYSAGFGFRDANFFMDFAYVYTMTTENYYFYDPTLTSPSVNDSRSSSVLMTFGFKF